MIDWRPPIGTRVRLVAPHPWAGSVGVVSKHEAWMGKATLRVRLERDDAMDGHEAGVTGRHDFEVIRCLTAPTAARRAGSGMATVRSR